MARVIVTGGAGFIGRHLVSDLLRSGDEVLVVDSGETGRIDLLPDECEIIHQDISELSLTDWKGLLRGIEVVYHLAARKYNTPGVTAEQLISANATATLRLAQAAAQVGVRKFIYASTLYAYGSLGPNDMSEYDVPEPKTVYGAAKLFGEHALRNKDLGAPLSWAVARFFFVYGPGQFAEGGYKSVIVSNFERIAAGEAPLIFGDGEQTLDYVYVGDIVRGLRALANTSENVLVNLGSGYGASINEVTALMRDVARSTVDPAFAPVDWTAGTRRVADIRRVKQLIGWEPEVSLRDGLQLTWNDRKGVA